MGRLQKIRQTAVQAFILVVSVVCDSAGKSPTEMFLVGEHYSNGSISRRGNGNGSASTSELRTCGGKIPVRATVADALCPRNCF